MTSLDDAGGGVDAGTREADASEVLADAIGALPQRPPMRLLDRAVEIDGHRAVAQVCITDDSLFFIDGDADAGPGVPSWVALEYLGQTAALIGQASGQASGQVSSRVSDRPGSPDAPEPAHAAPLDGFLLGSRQLDLDPEPFRPGDVLTITCTARGEVGTTLATFDGQVHDATGRLRASGTLSVVRVPRDPTQLPPSRSSVPEGASGPPTDTVSGSARGAS